MWECINDKKNLTLQEFVRQNLTSIQKYKIFNKLGEKRSAEKEITNLIKKYPKKLEYLVMLSDVYILNNKDANVLDLFKKMININSENGFIYFYIANYYKNKNNIEKFKENLELAVLKDNVDINYKIQYIIIGI